MNDLQSNVSDARRRCKPSLTDTDYLVLRGLWDCVSKLRTALVRKGHRILDFGCGSMPFRLDFEGAGCEYVGADFGPGHDLQISDEGCLPPDLPSFDGLVSFQVLEHVRDLDRYFAEANRALLPNGWIILSTHGTWLYHPHPGDYRRWTRQGLWHDIKSRGFHVVDIHPVLGPLAWTTVLRLTGYAWALRKIPIVGGALSKCLGFTMNVRAVIEDYVTPPTLRETNACVYVAVCLRAASGRQDHE